MAAMLETTRPFVLLDDAGAADARCRLFRDPAEVVVADTPADVAPALERLRAAVAEGRQAAGYLAYEAGEPLVRPRAGHAAAAPLLWFGVFDDATLLTSAEVSAALPDPAGGWLGTPQPQISRADYGTAIDRVQAYIAAGDIYQANLTFRTEVALHGDPLACYAAMRARSIARWGGVVWTGARWLLSLSPELFFECEDGRLVARPMKGTAARAPDDAAAIETLRSDPKQRAENLMIVDLLRNDLSRVAAEGSVRVPRLFEVETYPTLHAMTSTVEAELAPGRDAIDLLAAAFPCGSVTGAPKRRAMEVIAEIEGASRGPYTGSIGYLAPGEARFNVAIRTLALEAGATSATLGLGSGVVADSKAEPEWRECLAKGAFVATGAPRFDLIETMRFDAMDGLLHLEHHMARLRTSAAAFGFRMDHHGIRNELQAATFRLRDAARVRLRLSPTGAVAVEVSAAPPPMMLARVALVPLPVSADDLRLRHKTSTRGFYDAARHASGADEVVFVRPDGFLTEGSFTNLFVPRNGQLATPPLARGLLPGVLRTILLEGGRAIEADLTAADLAGGFLIGNALRDLIPARLVAGGDGGG